MSRRLRQLGLTAALLGGATLAARAQFSYNPSLTNNVAGTFTSLGTTGTAIATANTDDANSAAQNIGFTFNYNGTAFTQFVLNTNGLIRLGANAPSKTAAHSIYAQTPELGPLNSTDPADVNLLLPFNIDLVAGSAGASYRVATTGTAPNRVCTIEWTNVADKETNASSTVAVPINTQLDNFSFQVKLYETSSQIEFVYGSATAGIGTANAKYVAVGIKGSGSAAGQDVIATKASTALWSAATFLSGPYAASSVANAFNVRQTVLPDAGRTIRFSTPPPVDAAVLATYTLPKLSIPLGTPHVVQAAIANYGTTPLTNVAVTLRVTGANPFTATTTIPSIPLNDTVQVSLPAFSPIVLGTNTVTVSVADDGNNNNNSRAVSQQVTTNVQGYTRASETNTAGGVGNNTAGSLLVSRFSANTATTVNSVSVFVSSFTQATSVGRTVFGVVTDATTGAILGRSADLVLTAADVNTVKTFTINAVGTTTPLTVPAGSFLAGLGQAAYTGATFFPMGLQTESPTRTGAFYIESVAGSTPEDLGGENFGSYMVDVNLGSTPTCLPPTAATFSAITGTSAQVTFTGGTASPTSYTIVYGPAGFDPTSGGTTLTSTTLPITLTGLTGNTVYQVYVRTNCSATNQSSFSGPYQFQTSCPPTTTITTFPYNQNFDTVLTGQLLPCGFTVLDANGDGTTWRITTSNPNSAPNAMRYSGLTAAATTAADDWFFTPMLTTSPGTRYQVAFRYRAEGIAPAPSNFTEGLEVKAGATATVAGQTTTLYRNTSITNTTYALANGASAPAVAVLTPTSTTQYLGFHAISAANQNSLYVDDLSISTVLATSSETLLRAVTVFPNPSTTGLFDLDIHTAQAKGTFDVQVTNALGQQVYTGTARDNATNRLDLSNLAAGIYHLRVRQGDDFMTRTVSIVK